MQRYEPHCGKMPYLALLKNPLKIPGSADPEADDIQNLSSSSLCTDTSLWIRHVVKMYIRSKIFTKIRSVVLRKVADRQTNRQINAGHYIASLAEVTVYFTVERYRRSGHKECRKSDNVSQNLF